MDTIAPDWLWVFFVATALAALFIDFVVLNKQGAHSVSVKEALNWSLVWVALSLAFNALFGWAVYREHGSEVAATRSMESLTGYLIEKSLASRCGGPPARRPTSSATRHSNCCAAGCR
jgi:tellurite resistance protein TerC